MTAEGLAGQPEGQFGALLRKLRAELAAMRGQYDEIDRELRAALRDMSDTTDYQVAQPARYITALIALGLGDLAAARNAADAGLRLPGADLLYGARYTWPLVWLGRGPRRTRRTGCGPGTARFRSGSRPAAPSWPG